ncbi:sugar nucleotide-binding protein [Luteolibacter ambystomatis]|uniref:dTDP-4-dehydrorhamnose reductase n=1 Tax=Luteolibacter ambystomatis TaxID=2824561 RepID=A0A975G764_9BACT|nr:NAD(P)-dependent oxidoreductase [Luteolibacter ambystomatis]QUE50021.1 sugar nucleotide-binding protein [Luteolibacter ambystomatis]
MDDYRGKAAGSASAGWHGHAGTAWLPVVKVAVTGTTGRVGAALARYFQQDHEVIGLPRREFDLADPARMAAALEGLDCDVFLNPAGLTGLEASEDDPVLAHRLNAEAPGELVEWAQHRGVHFIHFSTDYVFSGEEPGLRTEEDEPRPLSVYGRTKREGELAVLVHPGACVVRVSWVFGPEKPSFTDSIMRAALEGRPVSAIGDKWSLPTFTRDLSEWVGDLVKNRTEGVIHACQSGEPASWHDMAEVIVDELVRQGRLSSKPVIEATMLDSVAAFRAPRPRHTAMATNKLAALLDRPTRAWQDALREYVRECR